MIKSAESVVVARTPDEVFRYVADLRNEPKWHVDIDTVPPETDPVPIVGKTYPLKFKPFMVPRRNKVFVENLRRALES